MTAVPEQPSRLATKQTSLTLPVTLIAHVDQLATAKYGQRGMARWVDDVLQEFLAQPDFVVQIGASEAKATTTHRKSLRLTPFGESMLIEGVKRVRKVDPTLENVRSQILRAAFRYAARKAGVLARPETAANDEAMPAPTVKISDKAPGLGRKGRKR